MPAEESYTLRVFARSPRPPSLQSIIDHLRRRGFEARSEPGSRAAIHEDWQRCRLFYADRKLPLTLERQSLHGDAPLPDRLRALMDATTTAKDKRGRQRVLDFLAQSNQVFELTLPPDFDWHMARHLISTELLNYLEQETDGMIQADEEGYYQRNRLILRLDPLAR